MFITIYKEKRPKNTQLNFDFLFNNPNTLLNTLDTINKRQITLNIEKYNNPTHIEYCKTCLKHLVTRYPEIMTLTKTQINASYTKSFIPKKTGGFRQINAPNETLKEIQRHIVNTLQSLNVLTHNSAYAYVKGRSTSDALKVHQENNSNWFLHIDLKDFFGSCNEKFIYQQLSKIYPFCLLQSDPECDTIIKQIIKMSCLRGVLPQGNPISPYLTNLIMVPLDYELNKLAPVYTRYSDDLLFSARHKLNKDKILQEIKDLLKDTPLKINPDKTRLGSKNGNNWNLGLMLNKENNITIGHEKKRQFKAALDQFLYHPENYSAHEKQKLSGITAYYLNIEPGYFTNIINRYNSKHNKDFLKLVHTI